MQTTPISSVRTTEHTLPISLDRFRANEENRLFARIVGASPQIKAAKARICKLAGYRSNVLLIGESGTGKELFAELVHHQSNEIQRPYVTVNCAAIPNELVESVFFGHEKGSFTGAVDRKIGKFEMANGGDILLDEVSCLSPTHQAKLLRVLESKEIERVGGSQTIKVDFRVIAATNEDLALLVKQGLFREDLFYRLRGVEVRLPALRDRGDDIITLAEHFLVQFCRNRQSKYLTASAKRLLKTHHWRGNVRELKHVIENLVILTDFEKIDALDVRTELDYTLDAPLADEAQDSSAANPAVSVNHDGEDGFSFKGAVEEFERQVILEALRKNQWSKTKACQYLGITRNMLYRKIDNLHIAL